MIHVETIAMSHCQSKERTRLPYYLQYLCFAKRSPFARCWQAKFIYFYVFIY